MIHIIPPLPGDEASQPPASMSMSPSNVASDIQVAAEADPVIPLPRLPPVPPPPELLLLLLIQPSAANAPG